jgi:hypothetical protein
MSRRSLQHAHSLFQATTIWNHRESKFEVRRSREAAIALLTPNQIVMGDGTAFRGGMHPDATAKGQLNMVCTRPAVKPLFTARRLIELAGGKTV